MGRTRRTGGVHVLAAGLLLLGSTLSARAGELRVGVGRVDITPEYSIRMAGYASRLNESKGVAQRLWTKALAIAGDGGAPAVLITVDNCGVPAGVVETVARRLQEKRRLPRERLAICSSHTHSAPVLKDALPAMFGRPVPDDHQAKIDRYTRELTDAMEKAALAALDDLRPGRIDWGQGKVGFAMNRRVVKEGRYVGFGTTPEGPVDHAMPLLRVTGADGGARAFVINYACHCTTLGGEFSQICGDWAGFAQEQVEKEAPGSVCLITTGCGGDANPHPRGQLEHARQHGQAIADEVRRLLQGELTPVTTPPVCRLERIELPFEHTPTREEWKQLAESQDVYHAYQAKLRLARPASEDAKPEVLSYPVQSWRFGERPVMVFLAGEVVVDYALRLKKELGDDRLWVSAYANDVPCYIASRRVLAEGGYEAVSSMIFYDRPGPLAPAVEDMIVAAVHRVLGAGARADTRKQGEAR